MASTGQQKALDTLSGKAAYGLPTLYMALTTTAPTWNTAGTEVTTGQMTNYARVALTGSNWGASSAGTAAYNALIDFLSSSGGTGTTVVGYDIYDASSSGNRLWYGSLSSTAVTTGTHITIASGALTVTLPILASGDGFSTTYANKLVDHMTGKTAYGTAPSLYAALTTAASTATALGTELSYTGYARTLVGTGSLNAAATTATLTVSGATNANPIVITTTTAHGLVTGDLVTISGVGGNTAANVTAAAITVISTTTFSIAVTGNGAYTSGGTVTPLSVTVTTSAQVNFPAATSAGGANVTGYGFMDASSSGVLICAGTLPSTAIANGTTPDLPSGSALFRLL